jgi:hypothetical protein
VNFNSGHYIPVLKVKQAEKHALKKIAPSLRSKITPLLEFVERNPDKSSTIGRHLDTAFKDLASAISSYGRCLLDARELEPDGPSTAEDVFSRAASAGMKFTPVTGLSRTVDVAAAISHRAAGIALRITREVPSQKTSARLWRGTIWNMKKLTSSLTSVPLMILFRTE